MADCSARRNSSRPAGQDRSQVWRIVLYARTTIGTTFSGSTADAPQFMRLAIAALCSLRRWPYVRATKTPPSLWPSQLAMTLKSIPASMALEQKKCRQVWCPYCG